jgi:hypothetical protein
LALRETACWWARHGQKERSRQVLAAAGDPGAVAPRYLSWSEVERLLARGREEKAARRGDGALGPAWAALEAGDLRGAVELASRALEASADPYDAPALELRRLAQQRLAAKML